MGRCLINDYKVIAISGTRIRTLIRAIRFFANCLQNTKLILMSFTCDIAPYPHLSDSTNQIFSPQTETIQPREILEEIDLLLQLPNYHKRICLITPFPRPNWSMTQSNQPRSCVVPSQALSKSVDKLYEAFIQYCTRHRITYIDIFNRLKSEKNFVQNDIHLSDTGKKETVKAIKNKLFEMIVFA